MYVLSLKVRTLFLHSIKKYTIGCYLYSFTFECNLERGALHFQTNFILKWPKNKKSNMLSIACGIN